MKYWVFVLFAWIVAPAATPANAFMALNGWDEAGYFSASQREQINQPANHRCEIRKDLLSGWLAAWIGSASGYSAGRTKNKADCAAGEWLQTGRSLLVNGRELMLRLVRVVSLNIH